jgi:hypothetical protein
MMTAGVQSKAPIRGASGTQPANTRRSLTLRKLSKANIKTRDDIVTCFRNLKGELEKAIGDYNETVADAFKSVEEAKDALNEAIKDGASLRDDIVAEMDEYVGERSEKWQESDAASEYEGWKSEWEGCELEEVEIEKPEDIDMPDFNEEALGDIRESVNE